MPAILARANIWLRSFFTAVQICKATSRTSHIHRQCLNLKQQTLDESFNSINYLVCETHYFTQIVQFYLKQASSNRHTHSTIHLPNSRDSFISSPISRYERIRIDRNICLDTHASIFGQIERFATPESLALQVP